MLNTKCNYFCWIQPNVSAIDASIELPTTSARNEDQSKEFVPFEMLLGDSDTEDGSDGDVVSNSSPDYIRCSRSEYICRHITIPCRRFTAPASNLLVHFGCGKYTPDFYYGCY